MACAIVTVASRTSAAAAAGATASRRRMGTVPPPCGATPADRAGTGNPTTSPRSAQESSVSVSLSTPTSCSATRPARADSTPRSSWRVRHG